MLLFLGMRAVMDIGGSCASGGPYVTARPCPQGVGWLLPVSINLGLALVFVSTVAATKVGWPSVAWLGWPALFLLLGWNFWEYGLDPPGGGGLVWSWIVCGALFWVMGAGPVVLWMLHPEDRPSSSRTARAAAAGQRVRASTTPPPFRVVPPLAQPATTTWTVDPDTADASDDLVGTLERLAALHASGALTDDEYAAAKAAMLGGT